MNLMPSSRDIPLTFREAEKLRCRQNLINLFDYSREAANSLKDPIATMVMEWEKELTVRMGYKLSETLENGTKVFKKDGYMSYILTTSGMCTFI